MNFSRLEGFTTRWSLQTHHGAAMRWLVRGVYGWFLFNIVLHISEMSLLWGSETLLMRFGATDRLSENVVYALMYNLSLFTPVLWIHIGASLLSMLDRAWTFVPRLVAWFTGMLLYYAATPAFNGGILLMLLLAFYLIPFYSKAHLPERKVLNNASRLAAQIQVCILYVLATYFKLTGTQWIEGSALYYTFNIDHYSTAWLSELAFKHPWWTFILTWLSLAYQLFFPVLIWIKKARTPLLVAGVVFHVCIAFTMHLWDFSAAMLVAYLAFGKSDFTATR